MDTQSVLSQKAIALKKQRQRSSWLLSAPAALALFMSPAVLAGTIELSWDDGDATTTPPDIISHVADGICPATDSTSNIDFATVTEGDPLLTFIPFTLTNGNTDALGTDLNTNIIESSGIPDGFVLSASGTATASPFPATVAASNSITFQIALDPTNDGSFGGLVKINHDDSSGAVSPFQFCITGVVDVVTPVVSGSGDIQVEWSDDGGTTFTPIVDDLGSGGVIENLDFGTTDLNVPVSMVFKVSNTDTTVGNDFDLGSISLPSGFRFLTAVPATQTLFGDPTDVVTDGPSEFQFTVEFEASSEGATTGMLSIDNTEGNTAGDGDERPFNFFITGTVPVTTTSGADIQVWEEAVSTVEVFDGVAPTTEFTPTFAGVPVSRNFVITNIGDDNLNLSSITLEQNGLPFTWAPVSSPFPDVLAPNEEATLMVTFNAPDVGTYTGTLNIFNNATATNENPFDIPLVATASSATKEIQLSEAATPDIQVGDTVNFTATPSALGTSIAKTFTINNIGGTQLSIESVTFSSGGDGFTLGSFAATTLDASGGAADSATFDVTLNGDTPGSFQGTVSIDNDDDDENPFTFTVMGDIISSLTEPEVMVWEVLEDGSVSEITDEQTDIVDFSAAIGSATSKTFRVKNIGGVNLDLTALSPLPKGFSLVGVFPTEVQPSETVEFEVKLDTGVVGSYGGTLEFFSTDADENPFSFPIGASVEVPSPEVDVMDGTTPIASGTTVAVEFGPTSVGSTVSKIFTVENTGEADLNLLSTVTFSEGGDGFIINSFNPGPVAAGTFTNFTVTLSASASGTYTGTLSFGSDDSDENPYTFPVSGTVDSTPPVTEEIAFWDGTQQEVASGTAIAIPDGSPTAIEFGNTPVGTPAVQTFTVENLGSEVLNLYSLNLPVGFSLQPGITLSSVGPTNQISFDVTMDATAEGIYEGTLELFNSDNDETPYDFPLHGTVGNVTDPTDPVNSNEPEIQVLDGATEIVDGGTVDFGAAQVNTPVTKTLTVTNIGGVDLTLVAPITLTGNGFTGSDFTISTLAANATATFDVTLNATAAGTYTGSVSFGNNDSDENPFDFALNAVVQDGTDPGTDPGTTPSVDIQVFDGANEIVDGAATPIDLGTTSIGQPVTKTLTVKNVGTETLDMYGYRVPNGFNVASIYPRNLAAGGEFTVDVQLNTFAEGSFNGPIELYSTDLDENPFDFVISGSVTASGTTDPGTNPGTTVPEIQVLDGETDINTATNSAIDFGIAALGGPITKTFTVKNAGSGELTLNSDVVFAGGSGFSVNSFTTPITLATGESTTFDVTMDAATEGNFFGTLSFQSNDSDEASFDFPINGTVSEQLAEEVSCFGQNSILIEACIPGEQLTSMSATGEATDAMIVGGLSRYDAATRRYGTFNRVISTLGANEPILTATTIKVDSKHVGKKADLIVAGIHTLPPEYAYLYAPNGFQWYMLVGCTTCPKGWQVQALSTVENTPFPLLTKPELLPLKTIEQLPQYLTVEMFEGTFDTFGQLNMYVGYRVEEGEDQGKVIANIPGIEITLTLD